MVFFENMKKPFHSNPHLLIQSMCVVVIFLGLSISSLSYSEPMSSTINFMANTKVEILPSDNQVINHTPERKHILIEESRGLSGFFILGIVINVIMIIVFAWWFIGQWRQSKK